MRFKDYCAEMSDSEYRELDMFSYSIGKAIIEKGPLALVQKENKYSDALSFGSFVDILITEPENKDKIFYCKPITAPTESLLTLANAILLDYNVGLISVSEITEEYILSKIKSLNIWSNIKKDELLKTRYDTAIFWDYIYQSIEANGKKILSPEIMQEGEKCANILLSGDVTSSLFFEQDGIEVLKQPIILYKFNGVNCKAKLDLLRIDHVNKIIYPYDIKTGKELPSRFIDAFYNYKYYLQAVSYMLAIDYIRYNYKEFEDYSIEPFRFIYISKSISNNPVIWTTPMNLLDAYMNGWDDNIGFKTVIDDYKYYKENGIYDTERSSIENKFNFNITLK